MSSAGLVRVVNVNMLNIDSWPYLAQWPRLQSQPSPYCTVSRLCPTPDSRSTTDPNTLHSLVCFVRLSHSSSLEHQKSTAHGKTHAPISHSANEMLVQLRCAVRLHPHPESTSPNPCYVIPPSIQMQLILLDPCHL